MGESRLTGRDVGRSQVFTVPISYGEPHRGVAAKRIAFDGSRFRAIFRRFFLQAPLESFGDPQGSVCA